MSAYDQWSDLTAWEKAYIATHPQHALIIRESKTVAFEMTQARMGGNTRNGPADAFRHCFWSAFLARDMGVTGAYLFTTAHESNTDNPPVEKKSDLHNNGVGLQIGNQILHFAPYVGRMFVSNEKLADACMEALNDGKLSIVPLAGS